MAISGQIHFHALGASAPTAHSATISRFPSQAAKEKENERRPKKIKSSWGPKKEKNNGLKI